MERIIDVLKGKLRDKKEVRCTSLRNDWAFYIGTPQVAP